MIQTLRRDVTEPKSGYFRQRLVKNGWKVPCRIEQNESGEWRATVDGENGPWCADWIEAGVDKIWLYAEEIAEHEYLYLLAMKERADPDHPSRNPRKAVDYNLLKPIIPR